jgi:cellulose synthase/poly-beta-1,6-N-acetylglucosamine synthase-like glycosyltransferase
MMILLFISVATLFMALIYLLIGILIHIGLQKKYIHVPKKLKTSVLIAARNEEKLLSYCLESLENQNYPKELLQVIILNDRSTDNTRDIARSFCNRLPHFELIDIMEDKDNLVGKMNVLSQGINSANGEIILITDADCRVPATWISQMNSYFTTDVALVGSITCLNRIEKSNNFFDNLQAVDWLFLQAIATGMAGIGRAVSVLGNNFGFRKSVYHKIGGFKEIGFSLTEDMALLKMINQKTDFKIAYPISSESTIQSAPVDTFGQFFQQRKRWLQGGYKAPLSGWILMLVALISHLLIVLGLILFNWQVFFVCGVIMIFLTDFTLYWQVLKKLQWQKFILYFPAFEIFYFFYTVILGLSIVWAGKIKWKERDYQV